MKSKFKLFKRVFLFISLFSLCSILFQNCGKYQSNLIKKNEFSSLGNPDPIKQGNPEDPKICPQPCAALSTLTATPQGQIEIQQGKNYYIDKSIDTGNLIIRGGLYCVDNKDYSIKAYSILVNGVFECGSDKSPYSGKLVISLKGNQNIKPKTGVELSEQGIQPTPANLKTESDRSVFYRAFIVAGNSAELRLNGMNKVKMSRLSVSAQKGSSSLTLDNTTDWKAGDLIGLAPTGFLNSEDAIQSERIKIKSISGKNITLESPLNYSYLGNGIEFYQGKTKNFSLNQSAEVVLLSRNIVIQSDDPYAQLKTEESTSDPGGHVMIHDNAKAFVNSVEFYKMGQAGLMGRYPFHWHKLGDAKGQYLTNSSIHYSFQRCITIHGTSYTKVENNVCQDFRGHGLFLEDGDEVENIIRGNVIIGAEYPHQNKLLLYSDDKRQLEGTISGNQFSLPRSRFPAVSSYWISNPNNIVEYNIAAGSVGTGFWNSFEGAEKRINTLAFNYNIAHTTHTGITWDGGRLEGENANNPNNPNDKKIGMSHYHPSVAPTFNGLIAYNNKAAGIYFRGQTAVFNEALLSDNGWDFFVGFNQILTNSIIARSKFHLNNHHHIAVILYDGPFELHDTYFYNFKQVFNAEGKLDSNKSSVPFQPVGGAEKFTNIVSGVQFNGERPKIIAEIPDWTIGSWSSMLVANSILDLDGSLTGNPGGGYVIAEGGFAQNSSGCENASEFRKFKICPKNMELGTLHIMNNQNDDSYYNLIRNDGQTAYQNNDFNRDATKVLLPHANAYSEYEIRPRNLAHFQNGVGVYYYNVTGGAISPVFKIDMQRSGCRVEGGQDAGSSGNILRFKMHAGDRFNVIMDHSAVRSRQTKAYGKIICS